MGIFQGDSKTRRGVMTFPNLSPSVMKILHLNVGENVTFFSGERDNFDFPGSKSQISDNIWIGSAGSGPGQPGNVHQLSLVIREIFANV